MFHTNSVLQHGKFQLDKKEKKNHYLEDNQTLEQGSTEMG